jgi:hypothetical protein
MGPEFSHDLGVRSRGKGREWTSHGDTLGAEQIIINCNDANLFHPLERQRNPCISHRISCSNLANLNNSPRAPYVNKVEHLTSPQSPITPFWHLDE